MYQTHRDITMSMLIRTPAPGYPWSYQLSASPPPRDRQISLQCIPLTCLLPVELVSPVANRTSPTRVCETRTDEWYPRGTWWFPAKILAVATTESLLAQYPPWVDPPYPLQLEQQPSAHRVISCRDPSLQPSFWSAACSRRAVDQHPPLSWSISLFYLRDGT